MHRKYLVGALAACACFIAGGLRADVASEAKESKILARIHLGNQMEIQLGERAKLVAERQEVRTLGDNMVTYHRKADEELLRFVELNKIRLSAVVPETSEEAQQMAEELEVTGRLLSLSGANFDRDFLQAVIRCHERAIRKFQECVTKLPEGEVRKWVESLIPAYQSHLEEARRVTKALSEITPVIPSKSPKEPTPQVPPTPVASPKVPATPITSPKLPEPITSPKLPKLPSEPSTSPKLPTLPAAPVTTISEPEQPAMGTSPKAPSVPAFSPKQPAPQQPEQIAQPQQPKAQQPLPQQPLPQQPKAQQPVPFPGGNPQQPGPLPVVPEVPLQP